MAVSAATAQELVPAPPSDVTAGKAYAMLERSCARCHQTGLLQGNIPPGAGIANMLALEELARDPALVRPGLPDASFIYNVALTRDLHHDAFNDPGVAEPGPGELQALRDWISDLPTAPVRGCIDRKRISREAQRVAIDASLAAIAPESARQTRFVSLTHLHDACASSAELDVFRDAVSGIVVAATKQGAGGAGGSAARQTFVAVDPDRLVLAISLTSMGWRPEDWERLVASYPLRPAAALQRGQTERATNTAVPVVAADWFAHALLSSQSSGGRGEVHSNVRSGKALWGLSGQEALAQAWRRPADLERVAAELGALPAALGITLAGVTGEPGVAARRLRAGGVASRPALHRLYAVLNHGAAAVPSTDAAAQRLEIALSADKPTYKSGDTASFSIAATRDCHLTLVGVDRAGRATILFPNELEPDNRIKGGEVHEVPGRGASYRFRFKEKGRETIVAVCSLTHRAPYGVVHDYDRLRFTVLGDWQLFLREPPEMKDARRDDAATDQPRPEVRRRRGRAAEPKATVVETPDVQTRTAIMVTIE